MEKKIANTLLEKPIKVTITEDGNKREFSLKPPTLGTLIAIGAEIQDVKAKDLDGGAGLYDITTWIHETMFTSGENVVNILAIALTNNNPTDDIKKLIKENVTAKELSNILGSYLGTIQLQDFINSIVLIKSSDIIKTSPTDQRS